MRIRKRKVPLPLSQLSPIPLDHQLFSRLPVIIAQEETTHHELNASDLHRSIDDGNSSSDHHRLDNSMVKQQVLQLVSCLGVEGVESVPKCNDSSKKSKTTLGAAADSTCSNGPSPSPNNHEEKARWSNEDKTMPLKKIKGSLEETTTNVVDMAFKSSENFVQQLKDNHNTTTAAADNSNDVIISGKKGSKRGKTIMEGSRCSRVNGRGWRCCQPTLVGYSLCEHHLGKGRLRSMSSVRGRPSSTSKKAVLGTSSRHDCSSLMQLCEAAKKESDMLGYSEKKGVTATMDNNSSIGKRVKLGVVKARSLSSLLGQQTTSGATSFKDGGMRTDVQAREDVKDGNANT